MEESIKSKDKSYNRRALLLIMGLPLALMLLSYTLMYLVDNKNIDLVSLLGSKTIGSLIKPLKPIGDLPITDAKGQRFVYASQPHKWTLLVLNSPRCGQRCEQNLMQSRQMHIALGKEQSKLRRYQLYLDGRLSDAQLNRDNQEQHHMQTLYAASSDLKSLLADQSIADWNQVAYILVDKRGWLMMVYDEDVNERDIMKKDLHHLFKYAQ